MARRKKAALDVPASEEEAIAVVASYSADDRETIRLKLVADEVIAGIKEERDRQIAEIEARQKLRFAQLKAWWEAAGHQMAKSGRRSAELAGHGLTVVQVDEFFIDTGLDEDAIRKELTASA